MKKITVAILITILVSLTFMSVVSAQNEELTLSLSRDFGYGGFNGDIQGTFSVKTSGPANLERVQFFLDETLLGEDTEAPFAIQFVTDNYPTGAHIFSAVGYTADGKQLKSQTISALCLERRRKFCSAQDDRANPGGGIWRYGNCCHHFYDQRSQREKVACGRHAQLFIWGRNLPQMQTPVWFSIIKYEYDRWKIDALPTLRQVEYCETGFNE
jgi:hypothetical protein